VLEDQQAELAGEIDSVVGTVVVDQDADVDQVGQLSDGDLEGLLRIVGGHDDRDALAVDHGEELGCVTSLPEMVAGVLGPPGDGYAPNPRTLRSET